MSLLFITHRYPHWKYVRNVRREYIPHYFKSNMDLNDVLKCRMIVNESKIQLTDEDIETLALGYNFVPNIPPRSHPAYSRQLKHLITQWKSNMEAELATAAPEAEKITEKGWLTECAPTYWEISLHEWNRNPGDENIGPEVRMLIHTNCTYRDDPTPRPILESWAKLKSNENIIILPSAKGNKTVIQSIPNYNITSLRRLSQKTEYKELTKQQFEKEIIRLAARSADITNRLLDAANITDTEWQVMKIIRTSGANVHFLPQLDHGWDNDTRLLSGSPVVNGRNSPVHWLDLLLTNLTDPLLTRMEGTIHSPEEMVQLLKTKYRDRNTLMTRIDMMDIYNEIQWDEGVEACVLFYKWNRRWLEQHATRNGLPQPPTVTLFADILITILDGMLMKYRGFRRFKQTKGIARGLSISTFFIETFIHMKTKEVLRPRFDRTEILMKHGSSMLIISAGCLLKATSTILRMLEENEITYQLENENKSRIMFMESTLINYPDHHRIETTIETRIFERNNFVHPMSAHPWVIIADMPLIELQSIRRSCSNNQEFIKAAKKCIEDLVTIGYDRNMLRNACWETIYGPGSLPDNLSLEQSAIQQQFHEYYYGNAYQAAS